MEILWSRIISSFVSYENANLRSNNLLTFYLRPSSSKHKLIKKKKLFSELTYTRLQCLQNFLIIFSLDFVFKLHITFYDSTVLCWFGEKREQRV